MKIQKIVSSAAALALIGGMVSVYGSPDKCPLKANALYYDIYGNRCDKITYDNFTLAEYSDHYAVIGCDEEAESIVIPDKINGLPVTSIYRSAFDYCIYLETIEIPESITSFGINAFRDTKWLENKKLENPLVIVNDVLIDGTACTGDVVIPDGVTCIGDNAFYKCSEISSVEIPDSVTRIGEYAFEKCQLITELAIPESVESIGMCAFYECLDLEEITLPDGITDIGGGAFCYTPWLENKREENPLLIINNVLVDGGIEGGDIVIPDGVTAVGSFAFVECPLVTSIDIPESVTEIRDGAFWGCADLMSITIPGSVTKIGNSAFEECKGLTEIVIPDSVVSMGNSVFYECDNLTKVVLSKGITSLGANLFSQCSSLTDISIPDSVKSIGFRTFSGCSALTEITIPEGVGMIEIMAFTECIGLTEIVVPESVEIIDPGVFRYCSALEKITIKNPACEIADYAHTISNSNGIDEKYYFSGTIFGYDNSTAQTYAEKYGYAFESLGEAPVNSASYGDANCDGDVTMADAVLIMQSIANPDKYGISGSESSHITEQGEKNGDCYDPGSGITVMDALSVQKYLLSLIDELPEISK